MGNPKKLVVVTNKCQISFKQNILKLWDKFFGTNWAENGLAIFVADLSTPGVNEFDWSSRLGSCNTWCKHSVGRGRPQARWMCLIYPDPALPAAYGYKFGSVLARKLNLSHIDYQVGISRYRNRNEKHTISSRSKSIHTKSDQDLKCGEGFVW